VFVLLGARVVEVMMVLVICDGVWCGVVWCVCVFVDRTRNEKAEQRSGERSIASTGPRQTSNPCVVRCTSDGTIVYRTYELM
jgi:hypothetical protein